MSSDDRTTSIKRHPAWTWRRDSGSNVVRLHAAPKPLPAGLGGAWYHDIAIADEKDRTPKP